MASLHQIEQVFVKSVGQEEACFNGMKEKLKGVNRC